MSSILWNLCFFLIALGVLIAVHEFGHFWVARRCGVKVERFSIGFGKSIWQRVGKDGTEYSLALIPLGGYVKMLDGRVDDIPLGMEHQAFDRKSIKERAAIVAAGPIANFLFAIFAYWIVLILGVPALKPVIGEVTPNSIAAKAQLIAGMELVEVSGVTTPDWQAVNLQMIAHIGNEQMTLVVKPDANSAYQVEKVLDLSPWSFDPENQSALETLGIIPFTPEVSKTVAQVVEGSAASIAGIQIGDTLVALNDVNLDSWQQLVDIVRANPNRTMKLIIERDQERINMLITPKAQKQEGGEVGYVGLAPKVESWPDSYRFELKYGPLEAIPAAFDRTWKVVVLTASMLKKLIVGDLAIKNLSGPISIAKGAGMTADIGLVYFLSFLALISVNLGIMNLLPLPVLDGGHLLFFGIEAIRRKPVPEKMQEIGYRIGTAIILLLMVVAIFNDFARL